MQSQDHIIIIPSSRKSKQEYARIDDLADIPNSPPSILCHDELVKIKESAEQRKRVARKRNIILGSFIALSAAFLILVLFATVKFVQSNKTEPNEAVPLPKEALIPTNNQPKSSVKQQSTYQKIVPVQTRPTVDNKPISTPPPPVTPSPPVTPPAPVTPSAQITTNNANTPTKTNPKPASQKPVRMPQSITLDVPTTNGGSHHPAYEHSEHGDSLFAYPTLGMPTPNTPFNFTEVANGNDYYQYQKAMDELFKPYNDTNCELKRYGDYGDGGYPLCSNLMHLSEGLINLGVEGRDLFGCDLTSEFFIPNYQYDCTNSHAPACSTNNNLNRFESACLSSSTEKANGVAYYSLFDMLRERNLTGRHVMMKIDVEGAEWPGLRTFPISDLKWIDQMVLEIHLRAGSIGHKQVWGNIDTLKSLQKEFVSVDLHMNNYACINQEELRQKTRFYPSFAIQVTLVNRRLITINRPTRSYALHPADHPNHGGVDCQLHD